MALYKGTSIVDYLNSKGQNYSFDARKQLAAKSGITGYRGSAEQNIRLLNLLNNGNNDVQKPINNQRTPPASIIKPILKPLNLSSPNTTPLARESTNVSSQIKILPNRVDRRSLDSGVIVDKRQNMSYIVKGGKIVKSDIILTGLSSNSNDGSSSRQEGIADKNKRVTPTGTYVGSKFRYMNEPGITLKPVAAFGEPATIIGRGKALALHSIYDPVNRTPLFNKPAPQRYASYGCVNYKPEAIRNIAANYSKGDTTIIVDSKNNYDADFISRMKARPTSRPVLSNPIHSHAKSIAKR